MSEPYVFGEGPRPDARLPASAHRLPFDFSKIPMLGNAGAKLNVLVYQHELDSTVGEHPLGSSAPGGDVKVTTPLAVRSPRKLLTHLLRATIGEANPSSAELVYHQLPNGEVLSDEEWAKRIGKQPDPKILPMWAADP